jgi:hypothetical protein
MRQEKQSLLGIIVKSYRPIWPDTNILGLKASDIILPLIRHQKNDFVKYYITHHKPVFDADADLIVKELKKNGDHELLDFLIVNGLVFKE